jgi:DNA-binding MarR family transcriptional regulator
VVTLDLTPAGRNLTERAAAWRRRELARIMGRLPAAERDAVISALSLLVAAAGDDYGVTASSPVPL